MLCPCALQLALGAEKAGGPLLDVLGLQRGGSDGTGLAQL